jgi:hypothetical protein
VDERPKVGGDTVAWCTSCKQMKDHVVVAMVGDKPAKVECAGCGKQHVYRAQAPGAPKARTTGARAQATRAKAAAPPEETVDIEAVTAGRPRVPYDPNARFEVGQVVSHPTFGVGLVTLLPGPQKVEIAFPSGARLLAHDRAAAAPPSLSRPAPRQDEGPRPVTDAPVRK